MELPLRASAAVAIVALTAAGFVACSGAGFVEVGESGDASPDAQGADGHAPSPPDASDANVQPDATGKDANGDRDAPYEAGGGGEDDAGEDAHDAHDGSAHDDGAIDAGADAHANDSGNDGDVADTSVPDTSISDTGAPDVETAPDANAPDVSVHDANTPDANVPEANAPDANVGVCTPGASRCVAQGSEYCTDHGTWNLQVGTCMSNCVAPTGHYLVAADALTVEDTSTGLVWQRSQPPASNDWATAASYCANLPALGGHGRLPTRIELEALVIDALCVPKIDQAAFPGASTTATWTSEASSTSESWVVEFGTGTTVTRPSSAAGATRCVR